MRANRSFLFLFCLLQFGNLLTIPAYGDEFKARVAAVQDGDSIAVMHNNVREKVILFGIDCPELKQDYGEQARQFTDQACYRKDVTIDDQGRDRRGRTIGIVYLQDGTNLNQELVRQGLAWWSDKYAPNDKTLKQLQEAAKSKKVGLWAAPNPIPPWLFRNGEKAVQGVIKLPQK